MLSLTEVTGPKQNSLREGAAIKNYHTAAAQPEANSCHSSGAPVHGPPRTQEIMTL